jgi:lipoyl(octanoyl) transferase
MDSFKIRFLGKNIPYDYGMIVMRQAIQDIDDKGSQLLLLEHEDVITVTRQHGLKNLITSDVELEKDGIRLIETDRGGDITFHGQGQLVGYPIFKLSSSKGPLDYVRALENCLTKICQELGVLNVTCIPGKTGVWILDKKTNRLNKLIAIGVGISKGVTRHGFAFNVTTNLERFTRHIIPCGLIDHGVTNLERELADQAKLPSLEVLGQMVGRALHVMISHLR